MISDTCIFLFVTNAISVAYLGLKHSVADSLVSKFLFVVVVAMSVVVESMLLVSVEMPVAVVQGFVAVVIVTQHESVSGSVRKGRSIRFVFLRRWQWRVNPENTK